MPRGTAVGAGAAATAAGAGGDTGLGAVRSAFNAFSSARIASICCCCASITAIILSMSAPLTSWARVGAPAASASRAVAVRVRVDPAGNMKGLLCFRVSWPSGRTNRVPGLPLPVRSIRSPRKAKAIEASGLMRLKKAKGT